ncbi:hypothetical protein [Synechococcus sp. FACHB-909]|uniref:hypothetical protein n=1 Tax=Synechococcus sp. FACHB-909 TaxID=2692863 RepID=UPI001686337B|nr:hypothetical protein [Synechococcus sp. FACHB-909]MBD2719321.1 hypothetical protein [Synechococcus sp. FACHB-909]
MAFQLRRKQPFKIETRGLGSMLFPPFLAGTLIAFDKSLVNGEANPEEFVRYFCADQGRKPCHNEADISLQYENGSTIDITEVTTEDIPIIAAEYLRVNETEMAWYASGDDIETSEPNKWQPAQIVKRRSSESDVDYFSRLAQECTNQSAASWKRISESFKSITDIGKVGQFALADFNATLSANRIKALINSPAMHFRNVAPIQSTPKNLAPQANDTIKNSLEELIGEVQKVSSLIAEQCEAARNQNIQTDLLIEASNESSLNAAESLRKADANLKWAKRGVFFASILSLLSLLHSVQTAHEQGLGDTTRAKETARLMSIASSYQDALISISKSIDSISDQIKLWPGKSIK